MNVDNVNADNVLDALTKLGLVDSEHSGDGLLTHLKGTYEILEEWGSLPELSLAGLCHSVYGTESHKSQSISLTERDLLKSIIGEEAERLTYLFGAHVKDSLWENLGKEDDFSIQDRFTDESIEIDESEFSDLVTLTLANWLEQRPRAPKDKQMLRKEEFLKSKDYLPEIAFHDFKEAYQIK